MCSLYAKQRGLKSVLKTKHWASDHHIVACWQWCKNTEPDANTETNTVTNTVTTQIKIHVQPKKIRPLTIVPPVRNSRPLPYLGAYMHPTIITGCFLGPHNLQIYNQQQRNWFTPSSTSHPFNCIHKRGGLDCWHLKSDPRLSPVADLESN